MQAVIRSVKGLMETSNLQLTNQCTFDKEIYGKWEMIRKLKNLVGYVGQPWRTAAAFLMDGSEG